MSYHHEHIDKKWQKAWEDQETFKTEDVSDKPSFYCLVEFPFPSGAGLHVGHPRSYTALDVLSRKRRKEGYNVLYPIGWDAFGLPTENYAIKTGRKPEEVTKENIANFRRQLKSLGLSFDWSREVNTSDPEYYKWTQWMFLEFFKAGLAYKDSMTINWCPSCKIGLANEEVVGGTCERCGGEVEKKEKSQWMIRITDYADQLIEGLNEVNYLPKIKKQQEDWIGRSEGTEIVFTKEEPISFFYATQNPSKIKRAQFVLEGESSIQMRTLEDVKIEVPEVIEGSDLQENARKKAQAFRPLVDDALVIGTDSGFFIDGVEQDPAQVRRAALEGMDEASMTQVEMAEKMLEHYKELIKGRGTVEAYWKDVFVSLDKEGHEKVSECKREVILHEETLGEVDIHFPLRSMYISKVTGKQEKDQTEGETRNELYTHKQAILEALGISVKVFTTRPDTLFGVKYVTLAPEHPMAKEIAEKNEAVAAYIDEAMKKSDIERSEGAKEKTGVDTGMKVVHPLTGEAVPLWVADYVLGSYGTGAVMAVPAHDERDFAFAQVHGLPVERVVESGELPYTEKEGTLVNSGDFNGFSVKKGGEAITEKLQSEGKGQKRVQYKLRDWVFSRQRYWGEPIPLVHCENGCAPEAHGWVAVPEESLPVTLPEVESYLPTDNGESPLANITEWTQTTCPICGGEATRETDTMPNWAGSSWYFLRYVDPHNAEAFASEEALKYWMPVDWYNGGMEHTTLHLLYSRFWNQFLHDRGHVPVREPYAKRTSHGLILAEGGEKMSKSKGNVVNPDDIVKEYGADTLRLYELFIGPFAEPAPWSTNGVQGVKRFLDRVIKLADFVADEEPKEVARIVHQTIQSVTEDIEKMRFNTAVASFMSCVNEVYKHKAITKETLLLFVQLLNPFAPHVTNELAEQLGVEGVIDNQSWPEANEAICATEEITMVVQVNGKVRANIQVATDATEEVIVEAAKADPNVQKFLEEGEIRKVIHVPQKLLNFVVV